MYNTRLKAISGKKSNRLMVHPTIKTGSKATINDSTMDGQHGYRITDVPDPGSRNFTFDSCYVITLNIGVCIPWIVIGSWTRLTLFLAGGGGLYDPPPSGFSRLIATP